VIHLIEDRLIPVKPEEGTDINSHAKEDGKGNLPTKGLASSAIEDQADVLETEKPARGRAAGAVHGKVGETFSSLITSFHGVLVLTMWFASPLSNA